MRRLMITISAAVLVLSIAPAAALARHHHRRHHSRVHHHVRIKRFGSDVTTAPGSPSSADNAGTVQSFQHGVLTISLGNGAAVSGAVTRDTETECMAPEQHQTVHEDGDRGSGDQRGDGDNSRGGDNETQGSGDQSAGEDQGDAAEQNENQAEDQNENQAEDQNENQAEDQNDNQAEDQNDNQAEENGAENPCSTMDLTPGTVVRGAELRISGAGTVWKKVELES